MSLDVNNVVAALLLALIVLFLLGGVGCSTASTTHYGCPFTISSYRSATIGDAPSACVIGDWWDSFGVDPYLDDEVSH